MGAPIPEAGKRRWRSLWLFAFVAACFVSCTGGPAPYREPSFLKAIRAEGLALIAAYPTDDFVEVPKDRLPPAIASLKPDFVLVSDRGDVDIVTKAWFDGGWGYLVRASDRTPFPERYSRLDDRVYWFRPY